MTPTQKAHSLVNEFYQPLGYLHCGVSSGEMWEHAKQCAIICVGEIFEATKEEIDRPDTFLKTVYSSYWQSVKTEIEKL